jgi:hypothetical protein
MLPGWLVPLVEKYLPEGYSLREDSHFVDLCFADAETAQIIGQWSWPAFTLQDLEGRAGGLRKGSCGGWSDDGWATGRRADKDGDPLRDRARNGRADRGPALEDHPLTRIVLALVAGVVVGAAFAGALWLRVMDRREYQRVD